MSEDTKPETLISFAEAVMAKLNGKSVVQYRQSPRHRWHDVLTFCSFDGAEDWQYRLKPEPQWARCWWIDLDREGHIRQDVSQSKPNKSIKVREVLPNDMTGREALTKLIEIAKNLHWHEGKIDRIKEMRDSLPEDSE